MLLELIVLEVLGLVLLFIGAFFELVAAIGMLRLPTFYTRMHALTIGAVGGTVVPLIGVALLAFTRIDVGPQRFYLAALCIVSAMLILIVAPTGSHTLVRSAYIHDKYGEERKSM